MQCLKQEPGQDPGYDHLLRIQFQRHSRKALMNESIKILPNYKKFNSYIENVKNGTTPMMLSGLTDSR